MVRYTLTEPNTGEKKVYDSDSDEARALQLGPDTKVTGGLFVIGTERHESRRVDRQLRGRCSRQGDPGLTKFFLSLEDDLMRLFLQGNLASRLMEGSMQEGEELEHPWLNRSIESAQKKVEQQNFAVRKRLLQYDDVLNQQREVVYGIRNAAIQADRPKDIIFEQIQEELLMRLSVAGFGEKGGPTQNAIESLVGWVNTHFPISLRVEELTGDQVDPLAAMILERIKLAYALKESLGDPRRPGGPRALCGHQRDRSPLAGAPDRDGGAQAFDRAALRTARRTLWSNTRARRTALFEELMNNVRLQICTGLFRSATNLQTFENMLALLSRTAARGRAGRGGRRRRPRARRPRPQPPLRGRRRPRRSSSPR